MFTLPRQSCRCGQVFGSLEAHLAHASLGESLPHDNPADIGLVLFDGEWQVKGSKFVTSSTPAVRPTDNPDARGVRTCKIAGCDNEFELPKRRGRPPVYCTDHRS